jgi:DNA-binding NtrC family response regulator
MLPLVTEPTIGTVLLIDGDEAVRQITARMLRSEGHEVVETSNLADARLALVQHGRIDLVLTDIGLAGPEFAEELSLASRNVWILFMTGGGPVMSRAASSDHETCTLLAKPYSRSQLLETVQQSLGKRRINAN